MATYLFAGGSYEVQVDGAETITKLYYTIAGQVVGMSVRDTETPETVALSYFLTDHLGSVVAVVSDSGSLLQQQRYLPFGEVRTDLTGDEYPIRATDFGYTFQRNIDAQGTTYTLGLMDYRARFYSSLLGRFAQADIIVPNLANTQAFNRYTYVYNNPGNLTDPTGHNPMCGPDGEDCVARQHEWSIEGTLILYGVTVDANMPEAYKLAILGAVRGEGNSLAGGFVGSVAAFRSEHNTSYDNTLDFIYNPNCEACRDVKACGEQMSGSVEFEGKLINCTPGGLHTDNLYQITVASMLSIESTSDKDFISNVGNVIHEFGHLYNADHGGMPASTMPQDYVNGRADILAGGEQKNMKGFIGSLTLKRQALKLLRIFMSLGCSICGILYLGIRIYLMMLVIG